MKCQKITFWCIFLSIFIVLIAIFGIYRHIWSGRLSEDFHDWVDFGTFFYSIGTLMLTALNVWIFFSLTLTLGEKEDKRQKMQQQLDAIDRFNKYIYEVYTPNEEYGYCDFTIEKLTQLEENLKGLKVYDNILPILSSPKYAELINNHHQFCEIALRGTPEEIGNNPPEIRAYHVYRISREVNQLLINDIRKSQH